jgi:hypothetical protein
MHITDALILQYIIIVLSINIDFINYGFQHIITRVKYLFYLTYLKLQ